MHTNPSSVHFVDKVEVDLNGETEQFRLQPQTGDPFTVELTSKSIQDAPSAKVRAHGNSHGWSAWSGSITIPEFPASVPLIFATLAATLLSLKSIKK